MSLSDRGHRLWQRLRALGRRDRLDSELDEELRFHLASREEQYRRAGGSAQEAKRQARLQFGNPLALREASRDLFSFARLEGLVRETAHAARRLRRAPVFTTVALATLALGIGANAALFSILDTALLRPLPYAAPERLLALDEPSIKGEGGASVAHANLEDYEVRALSGLAAYTSRSVDLTGSGDPETLHAVEVGARFFDVLGVQPKLGRVFLPQELDPRAPHRLAVLSHSLFVRRFGADPAAIGRTIRLDAEPYLVIGVLPPSVRAPGEIGSETSVDLYLPLTLPQDILVNRGDHEVDVVARLREGATLEQARAQLAAVGEALAHAHPDTNGAIRPRVVPLKERLARGARPSLLVLLGAVAVALLIACLNLSNLMLVRSFGRAREIAVRVALGAGRAQALRGTLLETALLALAGATLGLAVASVVLRAMTALAPAEMRAAEAHLDARVWAVSIVLAVLATFLAALLPARLVSGVRPHESLRSVERGLVAAPALRFGRSLLVAEVALSVILLVGGGLMLQSLRRLGAVDVGFETERVLATTINLPSLRYPEPRDRLAFFEELSLRVMALPGVEAVAFANRFPLRGGWGTGILLDTSEGTSEQDYRPADAQAVSPRYFEALGVPLVRGRSFSKEDGPDTPAVAVVTESFASRFFPGREALGHRFRRGPGAPWIEIVGVVADLRRDGQAAPREPGLYLAAAQTGLYPVRLSELAVRSSLPKGALAAAIQGQVRALDPEQPLYRVKTLHESLEADKAGRRFASFLLSAFAGLSLLLALVGIYGVTAYSVSRRTAEMGLRLALGAEPNRLLSLVLQETARSLLLGLALGCLGALVLARLLASLLFATATTDPAAYAGTSAVLVLAGLVAAAVPAWRASRVDATVALRSE